MTDGQSNEQIVSEIRNRGDPDGLLRLELLQRNQGFIRSVWRKFSATLPEQELPSLGFIAVSKACQTFDNGQGNFLQALSWSLTRELEQAAEDASSGVHLTRRLRLDIRQYNRVVSEITARTGKEPSDDEIMAHMGICEDYLTVIRQGYSARIPLSFDAPVSVDQEGDDVVLGDVIPDVTDVSAMVTEKSYKDSLAELFIYILSGLPQEQQTVIRSQYYSGETVKSISCDMGISAAEVRRLSSNAIKTMRRDSRLQSFLDEENLYLRSGLQRFRVTSESSTEYSALQLYYQKEGHK